MNPQSVVDLDDILLDDLRFWARPMEEREGTFALLRKERPVAWMKETDDRLFEMGPGYWSITKHADILHVSSNPEIFCSGKGATTIQDMPEAFLEFFGSLINTDDPKHKLLRGLISSGFTPAQLRKSEGLVVQAATKTLDKIIKNGSGDFVTDIAAPFPIRVICDIMGIPESQHEFVFDITNTILGGSDPEFISEDKDLATEIMGAATQLIAMMNEMRAERLKNPTDDLTTLLINAEIDGERLSEQDLSSFFILLANAGNETTRTALSQGMLALSQYPEQQRIWQDDFDGVTPTAIEEILRWGTPVIYMRRTATQDTELHGQAIKEGDKLILWYCSGNRDEDVFDDPFTFDVRRDPNDHVAFGGPGPHYCVGANLARREMIIMYRELFKRMPDLRVTGTEKPLLSLFIHGIKNMPIEWTPA
ncbi:MAG: cytochrome P450 [Candidatus Hydrogenedentota bacterium]|nr:MAG: cytochrome P450 [Candidatus Hydrogenedentota bacterium]